MGNTCRYGHLFCRAVYNVEPSTVFLQLNSQRFDISGIWTLKITPSGFTAGQRGNRFALSNREKLVMKFEDYPANHVRNARATIRNEFGELESQILNLTAFQKAWDEITSWPDYKATPLVSLPEMSRNLGLKAVLQKDEGKRFHLKGFKALGGAYAVLGLLQRHLREKHSLESMTSDQLRAGDYNDLIRDITVATATAGNHGSSVAWGAQMFGCRCKIYLHAHVSQVREKEIAKFGAEIVRIAGDYDASVRQCVADANVNGWQLVADTSSGGDQSDVPKMVMQGYTVMVQEVLNKLADDALPTHIFVPGGVGGLAASVAAHLSARLGAKRPRIIVVEPTKADCIFRSIQAGELTTITAGDTLMACLSTGEVSPLAWPILERHVDDVLALPDEAAEQAMRILAAGMGGDTALVAGESGAAAMAGLIAAARSETLRYELQLNERSRVVTIGSEGATDAETFARVVGKTATQIEATA